MEKLHDIYLELLDWLKYEGKPSKVIWHPLYYRYPWSLRFELGDPALDDDDAYFRVAEERAQRIWDAAFAAEDEVLLVFDGTPDRELKEALRPCRMQRVRAPIVSPFPGEDEEENEGFFYRYYYLSNAGEFPFQEALQRAFSWKYGVYFYNRTRKLLFHPYDDRGADLLGTDAEALRPFYESLHDFLLNWDREEMARKFFAARKVFLRILTTTTDPKAVTNVKEVLTRKLRGTEPEFGPLAPYWKFKGWGELNVTLTTAQPLENIQKRLAGEWGSDTASTQIHLPDVGFLWAGE